MLVSNPNDVNDFDVIFELVLGFSFLLYSLDHWIDSQSKKEGAMSFMKGDLLTKTRKLVKGLAKAEPIWLKAMEQ